MLEKNGAEEIGEYGYAHWAERPVTPGLHDLYLLPRAMFDGWEAYCSCGQWKCFVSFYEIEEKDALLAKLKERHCLHAGR
jgi:hypothetical protein